MEKPKANDKSTHLPIQRNVPQRKINTKKLKPGLVASYDMRSANGVGLFLFWQFSTYLLRHLLTAPGPTRGDPVWWLVQNMLCSLRHHSLDLIFSSSINWLQLTDIAAATSALWSHCSCHYLCERKPAPVSLFTAILQVSLGQPIILWLSASACSKTQPIRISSTGFYGSDVLPATRRVKELNETWSTKYPASS